MYGLGSGPGPGPRFGRGDKDPWGVASVPGVVTDWLIDESATGCTVVTSTLTTNIGSWTPTNVVVTNPGGITYRMTDTVDGGSTPHYVTSPLPTNGVRGVSTFEFIVTEWNVVTGMQIELNPAEAFIKVEFSTKVVTPNATVLWGICEDYTPIPGALRIRVSAKTTDVPEIRMVLQKSGGNYQGDGTGYIQGYMPLANGVLQRYATSIPDSLGISGALVSGAANLAFKLYNPKTDAWLGETGYYGGGYANELEYHTCSTVVPSFSGATTPITAYQVVHPLGIIGNDSFYAMLGGSSTHVLISNGTAVLLNRVNASGTQSYTLNTGVSPVTGLKKLIIGDYYDGATRRARFNNDTLLSQSQVTNVYTPTQLYVGGVSNATHAVFHTLTMVANYIPPGSYHDEQIRGMYMAKWGIYISTPPANVTENGNTLMSVVVGLGVLFYVHVDTTQVFTDVGTGVAQNISFRAPADMAGTALITLTTADGVDAVRVLVI